MYLSKKTVCDSFKKIHSLYSNDDKVLRAQGATQFFSALRYFLSVSAFEKRLNKTTVDCASSEDRNSFVRFVGEIVAVNKEIYSCNFYDKFKSQPDFNVGSNFFSQGFVNDSQKNKDKSFDYPIRDKEHLILTAKNERVSFKDDKAPERFKEKYLAKNGITSNLVIWLLRNNELDAKLTEEKIKQILSEQYPDRIVNLLLPGNYDFLKEIEYTEKLEPLSIEDVKMVNSEDEKDNINILYDQKIFFGAPGTGKSHEIKDAVGAGKTFRTTFHPDTDYASFVGCYKPQKEPKKEGGHITYSFVPQVFTKAYLAAWNAYLSAKDKPAEPVYLVIEEINRGNCAQIFGDIFQLLDRENGFSEYPIDVDSDLAEYIENHITERDKYCEKIKELEEQSSQKDGEIFSKIALPANLSILATMNTSDQSLFPMDSAFKRRFDWEYVPICFEGKPAAAYEIENVTTPNGGKKTWQPFVEQVNEKIKKCLASEDKQIGEFFVKADSSDTITGNQFISKVLFYLWQEVFKDEPDNENNIFREKDENGQTKTFTFQDLFNENKDKALKVILENVGLTWSPTKSNS